MAGVKLPPPTVDTIFEDRMEELFKAEYSDPFAKRYGRNGQRQQGIDIISRNNKYNKKIVIQCKCNDKRKLTVQEIENEYLQAIHSYNNGINKIDIFIILTTSSRDISYDDKAEELAKLYKANCIVFAWEDIVSIYENHPEIMRKHYADFVIYGEWIHYSVGKIFGIDISDQRGPQARYSLMVSTIKNISNQTMRETIDHFYGHNLYVVSDLNQRRCITWSKGDDWSRLHKIVGYGPYDAYLVTCWLNHFDSVDDMLLSGQREFRYTLSKKQQDYWFNMLRDDKR